MQQQRGEEVALMLACLQLFSVRFFWTKVEMQESSGCCLNWFTAFNLKRCATTKESATVTPAGRRHTVTSSTQIYPKVQNSHLIRGQFVCVVLVIKVVKRKAITIAHGVNCYSGAVAPSHCATAQTGTQNKRRGSRISHREELIGEVPFALQFPNPKQMQKLMNPLCFVDTAWF